MDFDRHDDNDDDDDDNNTQLGSMFIVSFPFLHLVYLQSNKNIIIRHQYACEFLNRFFATVADALAKVNTITTTLSSHSDSKVYFILENSFRHPLRFDLDDMEKRKKKQNLSHEMM